MVVSIEIVTILIDWPDNNHQANSWMTTYVTTTQLGLIMQGRESSLVRLKPLGLLLFDTFNAKYGY